MPRSEVDLLALTARIVVAYVLHNDVPGSALGQLIDDVHRALLTAGTGAPAQPQPVTRAPPPRKTVTTQTIFDDYLVCMECGLHMKMLKRHLLTIHNITTPQYRAKWNLPADYPVVARQYAALRSSLAKDSGLGKRPVPRAR